MRNNNGFTLLELMIVVAIIGILASIAVPTFTKAQKKARRVQGEYLLHEVLRMENIYYMDYSTYSTSLADLSVDMQGTKYYSVVITTANAGQSFLATATANLDSDATIDEMTIDQNSKTIKVSID